MKTVYVTILALMLLSAKTFSQEVKTMSGTKQIFLETTVIHGDTMPHVTLHEISIVPRWKLKSKREYRHYSRLVYNIKKTLPYARLAARKLHEIDAHMRTLKPTVSARSISKRRKRNFSPNLNSLCATSPYHRVSC